MIRKIALTFSVVTLIAADKSYLSNWTTYRLTEMFESTNENDLSQHFTPSAWSEFQKSLKHSNISREQHEHHYETRLTKFVQPVKITDAGDSMYFAQSTFLVKFSNSNSSWLQPMELILTIKDENGNIAISQFEGRAAKPVNVKNYALDIAKDCKL